MKMDWNEFGGLVHMLRCGHADATIVADAQRDAADEIERLKSALEKIAKWYPCATNDAMARVASEALGIAAR